MAAINDILTERVRQSNLAHGGNTNSYDAQNTANDWVAFICAYAGRAAARCGRNEREGQTFRANIVKVGALALAAVEAFDKGYMSKPQRG